MHVHGSVVFSSFSLKLLNVQYQNRNWIQIQLEKSQSLSFQEHN